MAEFGIQGEVQISSEGAENALDRVGYKAEQMASRLQSDAGRAGAAVDRIGSGAMRSADEFTRAEGRIAASIKRATERIETFGKSASQRLEMRIEAQGLDAEKFEPLIAKLREAEAAQTKLGLSARETAFALRGVPAQMTDIVTSLATGQRPMSVLLQQGGQLKDMFGGVGAAAQALGGYVLSLITPTNLLVAGVGAVAYAMSEGADESRRLQSTLIETGNAAGSTYGQLRQVAESVSAVTGATSGAVGDVLEQLLGTGKVAADSMSIVTTAVVSGSRAMGREVKDLVSEFADLGKAPVDASVKLNEQYNYLTASVYRQIKALEDQGKTAEAAALAQQAYADAVVSRSAQIETNLGTLQRLWRGLTDDAKGAWNAMAGLGRETSIEEQLAKAKQALGAARAGVLFSGNADALQEEVDRLQALLATEKQRAKAKQESNAAEAAAIDLYQQADAVLSKQEQKKREIAKVEESYRTALSGSLVTESERLKIEEARAKALAGITEKYKEKTPGGTKNDAAQQFAAALEAEKNYTATAIALTQERVKQQAITEEAGINEVLAIQESGYIRQVQMLEAQMAKTSDVGEIDKLNQKIAEAGNQMLIAAEKAKTARAKIADADMRDQQEVAAAEAKEAEALLKKAAAAEEENARIGLTTQQLQELTRRRYDEQIAIKRAEAEALRGIEVREGELLAIEQQIAALQRLRDAEIERPALQQSAAAWKDFTRDIEQSLTDALMRSFEAGDSFGKAFAKNLENTFKTMVLKFAVQAIVGGSGNILGFTTSAGSSGAFNTVSNFVSGASNVSQFYTGFTTGGGTGMWGQAGNWAGNGLGMYGTAGASSDVMALNYVNTFDSGAMASAGGMNPSTFSMGLAAIPFIAYALTDYFVSKEGGPKREGDVFLTAGPEGSTRSTQWVTGSGWFTSGGKPMTQDLFPGALEEAGIVNSTGSLGDVDSLIEWYKQTHPDTPASLVTLNTVLDDYSARHPEIQSMDDVFATTVLQPFIDNTRKSIEDLGGNIDGMSFGFGLSMDPAGTAPTQITGGVADKNGNVIYESNRDIGRGDPSAEVQNELKRMFIATVDAADINPIFEAIVNGIDEATASTEELGAAIASLNQVNSAIDLAKLLGLDESQYSPLLSNAVTNETLPTLTTNMGNYFNLFYSEEEKLAAKTATMSETFADLGLEMPLTNQGFRDLVDSLDLTTDAGQDAYETLLAVAPAFNDISQATAAMTAKLAGFDAEGLGQMMLDAAFNPAAGMTAAASFGAALESSVRTALINSVVGNVATMIYTTIVTPIMAGATVSQQAIAQVTASAQAAINTLSVTLQNLDLSPITQSVNQLLPSIQQLMPVTTTVTQSASTAYNAVANAANTAQKEWESLADSILGTIRELRGEVVDDAKNLAAEQARFAIATAAARAGDATAAEQLPDLARSIVDLGKAVTASSEEQALLTAQTLGSLRTTLGIIGDKYSIDIPAFASGGDFSGGIRLVGENGPEIEATGPSRIYTADQIRDAMTGGNLAEEIRSLREENSRLGAEVSNLLRNLNNHAYATAKVLKSASDGDAINTRVLA